MVICGDKIIRVGASERKRPMLYGEFQHNMDQKGRVTIPLKFREDLGDKFYVCKGLDNCLFVYSESQWQSLIDKIADMPVVQARSIQRFMFAGAADVEPDKQGRILLPASLREYAGLTREVTVTGSGSRAEIWDSAAWKAYMDEQTQEGLENAMEALGI